MYSIKIPSNNKYYIGVSKQKCHLRWRKSMYNGTALEPYLEEWQDMIKTVIIDGLSREESLKLEDELIQSLKMNNLCINEQRSGLIKVKDENAYQKELLKTNTEYRERCNQLKKKWYENNREREKERVKQWYENNKEKRREYEKQLRLKKKLEREQQQTSLPLL